MLDGQNGDIVILMELICSGERTVINIACWIVLSARRKMKQAGRRIRSSGVKLGGWGELQFLESNQGDLTEKVAFVQIFEDEGTSL